MHRLMRHFMRALTAAAAGRRFAGHGSRALLAVALLTPPAATPGGNTPTGAFEVTQALRLAAPGATGASATPVTLPDWVDAPSTGAALQVQWRVEVDLPATVPSGWAIYASGLRGTPRVRVNDLLLLDELTEPPPAAPRGRDEVRVLPLPPSLLQPGRNVVEFTLARRSFASLSALQVGPVAQMNGLRARKLFALVTAPALIATLMCALGLTALVLHLRRRRETAFGLLGVGGLLWGLHTLWTLSPTPVLDGVHLRVWWTAGFAFFVVPLALFCLRHAQRSRPGVERALIAATLATPALLYAAAAVGRFALASDAVRMGLLVLVFTSLGAVAHHAWHRRRIDSALLVACGLAGGGMGLRDWIVFRASDDNLPITWTTYSALPFFVLFGWILIDGFARASESLERVNRQLEQRVARRESELADNYERVGALERAQAAGTERQRVLRELHDGVGGRLFQALARVESRRLDTDGVADELRACLADMRLAIEALAPEQAEFGASLGNLLFRWDELLRDAGIQAAWDIQPRAERLALAPQLTLQLLRILQEALTNVLRHAQARQVTLALHVDEDGRALRLRVEDDGRGLPASPAADSHGLAAMKGRADSLGATLTLATPPGGGTRVEVLLPLAPRG